NPFAYRTTSLAIKTLSNLSRARVNLHGTENIPNGAKIFVVNHFTRLETFLVPYYLNKILKSPIWSLASSEFYGGALGRFLESVGAVSTKDPHRDRLIVKTLLTNEASWIIFPEGRMVKNKKIIEKGRFMVSHAHGKHRPHTGAAHLALRTEFYRQRIATLTRDDSREIERLRPMFNLPDSAEVSPLGTYIVPVNLTYYPLRARLNVLNKLAKWFVEDLSERAVEELMTEGAMLTAGVDIDMRFGAPIEIGPYLQKKSILKDIHRPEPFGFDDPLPCLPCLRKAAMRIMERYMAGIYDLTTINHDHIFASLLKKSPRRRLRIDNFRRRAFLAIQQGVPASGGHVHTSMQEDQDHLLLDDRYQKLSDFLAIAEEKGVAHKEGACLLLNTSKLRTMFDFNRARVDNPIAVMANEAEPLEVLQRKISWLSWMPGFILRRRIAKFFRQKAEQEFEADYHRFYLQGETKPQHIGRPILIRGRSRKVGILLCHGYMAAPAEVKTLAEYLGRKGYWVYVPRLKGHGTAPEDLAQCSYKEWIHSVEEGYLLISSICKQVIVGGFSTGAALALELASRIDDLLGVFAVATPLRLQDAATRLVPLVDTWNRLMKRMRWEEARKEYVENHPENPHINYLRNPIAGVRELERLMDAVEPRIEHIRVPALVAQSMDDPVVNPKGSERIFQRIGSEDKQYITFNIKRHGILLGEGSERVHRTIGEFVDQLRKGRRKPVVSPAPPIEATS
ncbi:MAG: alpha/beta fold hydrolase, partial [Desulfobacteraceae bacterium]|nr:alpha/beta fold hydrolase [Desulfobacteraceae bacterium]